MQLRRVVLYQNGTGYFEHSGQVTGTSLELAFRNHEIGDVLKTITIIQASGGSGAAAATAATLMPDSSRSAARARESRQAADARTRLRIALSRPAGDVRISYAVPTPTWKASYRLVLPEPKQAQALLQGWATINNASEQDWNAVELTLATGAPLSFAIDLHTPEYVARPDLTGKLVPPVVLGAIAAERALPGDSDGDGVKNANDDCPDSAEDQDSWEDQDGCPEPDNDRDRIADTDDQCPMEPETYNGYGDEDGCPDRARVVVTNTSIEILDRVYFVQNRADVKNESLPIIDAIAAALLGNPGIRAIEIQGHAAQGEADAWGLSRQRAMAVQRLLMSRGVTTKLVIKPYGPSMPLDPRTTAEARAKNRRVEFRISEREGDEDETSPQSAPADAGSQSPSAHAGAVTAAGLEQSIRAAAVPRDVAGAVRYEIAEPVTIPHGTSALVPIINTRVTAEDVYLFRPEPNAPDSSRYPWRAARLVNETKLSLQPGPMAIFGNGTFVGEGLIEHLYPGESAFVPYALDSSTQVTSTREDTEEPAFLVTIARGVATVENRTVRATRYEIRAGAWAPERILIRHIRSPGFEASELPPQTEDTGSAYLLPVPLQPGKTSVLEVKERQPVRRTIEIADSAGPELLVYLSGKDVPAELAGKVQRISELRVKLAALDEKTGDLRIRLVDVSMRAEELRASLSAIGTSGSAAELRKRLLKSLAEATRDSERIAQELALASTEQTEASVRLHEAVRELSFDSAAQSSGDRPSQP